MPPNYKTPGVYVEEIPSGVRPIKPVPTSVAAFIGTARNGEFNQPITCESWADFESACGGLWSQGPMSYAVRDFFANGGRHALVVRVADGTLPGNPDDRTGIYALDHADHFNLLCLPPLDIIDGDTPPEVYQAALEYCKEKRAMLLVDPPAAWDTANSPAGGAGGGLAALGLAGEAARNGALYFPRVMKKDPLDSDTNKAFVPCGMVAGVIARTDHARGVWKAPAGTHTGLHNVESLQVDLTDADNEALNPIAVNCLRTFPNLGTVVWGSRTLRGADALGDEYKYIPVRRFALFVEESLVRGLQWVVFEPNDEPLWAKMRAVVGAFMDGLFRQRAFAGDRPKTSYYVRCDATTTTEHDREQGIVRMEIGFAPLKPAEFVVLQMHWTGGPVV